MKKKLNKSIIIACIISLTLMTVFLFCVQSIVMKGSAVKTIESRVNDVIEKIESNDKDTKELVEQLNSEFISKADAFSEMIKFDPTILDNPVILDEIKNLLNVDELHVTDEYGIIRYGTVPEYYGFDFAKSDQAGEFMKIIDNPSIKIAQEAQPNGAEGKYFQYIGVTRQDTPGVVQIGNTPERLQRQIERISIQNVLDSFTVGQNGFIMAVSKEDDIIVAYPDNKIVGCDLSQAGFNRKAINYIKNLKSGFITINRENVLCSIGQNDNYIIVAAMPKNEVYARRTILMIIFVISILIVLAIITAIINTTVQKTVINGMSEILEKMKLIEGGNLEVEMDVSTCPEYEIISDGINAMLAGIRNNMEKSNKLSDEQKHLFKDVTKISNDIGNNSSEMQNLASRISDGSLTQANTIEKISESVNSVAAQIQGNANAAKDASDISNKAMHDLNVSVEKLEEMQKAMHDIEEASAKIENIVKTVEDFTFQTNILALNATVEAARAGSDGKGFAVVASEVRSLANKSAEATKGTSTLIYETKCAVELGKRTADETAESIRSMMNDVTRSNALIDGIASAANEQAEVFSHISNSISEISTVVQENASISINAKSKSEHLDEQAKSLIALFRSAKNI